MSRATRPAIFGQAVRGALAGVAATGAMSAFLYAAQHAGALRKQPPRIILESLAPELPPARSRPLSLAAHFGYGAAGGACYALLTRVIPRNAVTGAVFGLAIWAASYEGWLPALGILPPAHRDRRSRVKTMITAHVIYGASLGMRATRKGEH
jgi:hypothetical protein